MTSRPPHPTEAESRLPVSASFMAIVKAVEWNFALMCVFVLVLAIGLPSGSARAQPTDLTAPLPTAVTLTDGEEATLSLNHRDIVTFRATLLGDTPAERLALARAAIDKLVATGHPVQIVRADMGESMRFESGGQALFYVVAADLEGPRPGAQLEEASRDVLLRLQKAIEEKQEARNPQRLLQAAAMSLAASVLAYFLARLVFVLRRRFVKRLHAALGQRSDWLSSYGSQFGASLRTLSTLAAWTAVILLVDTWITFVLRQFAYTRPWGETATQWALQVLGRFAQGVVAAIPDLLVAILIFVLARMATRAVNAMLERVERGELDLSWIDADTAVPTRRLSNLGIWLFAVAMAYPYLPGSHSEAFKAVSVMTGLMLSLGASSLVGQGLSGLSLMYSRAIRVGEYVQVGDTEGTVTALGMFTTKVHTGTGEEVSLPNTVVFSQPIRNLSRRVNDGRYLLNAAVTIGYSTPWRQVHAMLLEATNRTGGVSPQPAPYVIQTALSDFYVEYRLCAQADSTAPVRRADAMNELHANIQDVFNENGVQIMSPHYMADPSAPQVVDPMRWEPPIVQGQK